MLPDGYNTVLKGDGSGLSQGQRQLLGIARAAVSIRQVMILDEATSSIDTRTEALVQSGMDKLMEGRTVFVIAHRLSTVKNADVIMVLDHGRIIERGNHAKRSSPKRACTTSSIPAHSRARIISCAPLRPAGGRGIIAVTKQRRRTMEYRRFGNTIVARIDSGSRAGCGHCAGRADQAHASVQALGAVGEFTVGVFHTAEKQYHANSFAGDFEIVSLTGTINTMDGAFTRTCMSAGNEEAKCSAGISTAPLSAPPVRWSSRLSTEEWIVFTVRRSARTCSNSEHLCQKHARLLSRACFFCCLDPIFLLTT